MATIQYARAVAPGGFSRAVVIKRLHPQFAKDPAFVSMFLDEARLSSRIAHANVVPTLDVIAGPDELAVVLEYVHGESLATLMHRASLRGEAIPARVAVTLMVGVLHGLHAAHETCDDHGEPLHIVHRDVSPENILVGSDGVPRLIDFGIARAVGRSRVTPAGQLKGKLAYMAIEQYQGLEVDRRADVYGASVVLWEALTGRELFSGDSDAAIVGAVMRGPVPSPVELRPELPSALAAIVLRGLSRDRTLRFSTAREMALALERSAGIVPQSEVSDWLEGEIGPLLAERAAKLRQASEPRGYLTVPPAVHAAPTQPIESAPTQPSTPVEQVMPSQAVRRSGLRTRRRGIRPLALALGLSTGAAVGAWVVTRGDAGQGSTRTDRPEQPRLPVPPASAVGAPPPPPSTSDAAMALTPELKAGPTPTEDAPPPDGRDPTQAPPRKRPSERTRATRRKPEVDCREPFVTDARGIRRVKPECL